MRTLITDGRIVTPAGLDGPGWLLIDGTTIADIGRGAAPPTDAEVIDAGGHYVLPGMIDLHVHGGGGHEVMEADPGTIPGMARFLARRGVTAFVPTTITADHPHTMQVLQRIAETLGPIPGGATNLGAHLEGPYLNARRKGAQPEEHIRPADRREVDEYLSLGIVRQVALAPEIEANGWLIDLLVERSVTVAAGHTDATAVELEAATARGVTVVTHVFNGMRGLHHRGDAGAAGAALTHDGLSCELIADGVHVLPAVMRLVWRAKGRDRTILITDTNAAAGVPPEDLEELIGRPVHVDGGVVRLEDGTITGSVTTLDRGFANFLAATGAGIEEAWPVVSLNPARAAGVADRKGSLEVGKDADVIILTADGEVTTTIVEGQRIPRDG